MKLALKLDEEQLPETPEDGDFEAGYHKARLMALARGHWLTWAVRAVAALGLSAAVVLISSLILLAVIIPAARNITDLRNVKPRHG